MFDLNTTDTIDASILRLALISLRDEYLRLRANYPNYYPVDRVKYLDDVLYSIDTAKKIKFEVVE
jgi:hypothetical protein